MEVSAEAPVHAAPAAGAHHAGRRRTTGRCAYTVSGIAELFADLTNVTPNANQVSINGAFAFDNIFLVNGVDVGDNLLGSPFSLFIKDADQEVQTLTSGISAEYRALWRRRHQRGHAQQQQHVLRRPAREFFQSVVERDAVRSLQGGDPSGCAREEGYEGVFGGAITGRGIASGSSGRAAGGDITNATAFRGTGIANTQTEQKRARRNQADGHGRVRADAAGRLREQSHGDGEPAVHPSLSIDPFTNAPASLPNSSFFTNYKGVVNRTSRRSAIFPA